MPSILFCCDKERFDGGLTAYVPVDTAEQYNINIEAIGGTTDAALSSINLFNGDYQFDLSQGDAQNDGFTKLYSIYSPDKDIEVEMDLYGGKGESANGNEPSLVEGKGTITGQDGYRSWAEVTAAMGDDRYSKDPAYQAMVKNKIANSEL